MSGPPADPHAGQSVAQVGAPLAEAVGAVVLLHGRGATASGILSLAPEMGDARWAFRAPQAAGGAWYPHSFLAPLAANEPGLSSGVRAAMTAVADAEAAGIPRERIVLAGFSQGACLALETAARHAGRWGGVLAFSGGLIGTGPGPDDGPPLAGMGGHYADKSFDYDGTFAGTPVLVAGSDRDPHIPLVRMERTAEVFRQLGAAVDLRVHPGWGHAVHPEAVAAARTLLTRLAG